MDLHATLIRNVIGPLWARWEGSPYLRHYKRLQQTQYDSPASIQAKQWPAIHSLVEHAYATVPYYRQRLDQVGLRPNAIHGFDDFRHIPILTKADLRSRRDSIISSKHGLDGLHLKQTSGSTGVAVDVFVDEAAHQFKRACTLRSDEWSGWRFGEGVARIWGNPDSSKRGWRGRVRNALLDRTYYLDSLRVNRAALARFAEEVASHKPTLLFGHAHSLCLFAEYVRSAAQVVIRPRGIIATAMVLHNWQRQVIEEVFQCRVTNRYGCEEVSLIACECDRHAGLHINAEGVYVEILRDGRPADPGEPGSVVVTDLANRAMPILRYHVGDVAVLSDTLCPCGRGLPMLQRLEGREADYVVTPAGELISGISLTDHFALHMPGVVQVQIIQETVRRLVFRIVRGSDFGPASLQRIAELVENRFGPEMSFVCEYLDNIPQEPSGKYRFCISRVENPFIRRQEVSVP
ncbi:MAG: phenylacetate--CoA ligase family protein [Gemmataceae bacterium]